MIFTAMWMLHEFDSCQNLKNFYMTADDNYSKSPY